MRIIENLCEKITDHKFRKGTAYSEGITPTEYHYKCRICGHRFWNYTSYKGAPAQIALPKMDSGYVYCTQCKHFNIDEDLTPNCIYEDECDILDCEDGQPFKERPKYERAGDYV